MTAVAPYQPAPPPLRSLVVSLRFDIPNLESTDWRLRRLHERHLYERGVEQRLGIVAAAALLVAGRYLLHGPAVPVRIAEEYEPDVV